VVAFCPSLFCQTQVLISKFANRGRFAHHYWFVWGSEALLHRRFNLLRQFMTLARDCLRTNVISKGEA
jgi:hypothetical protein